MKVTTSTFIKSVTEPSAIPEPRLPEIVIAGRSNVGKSSFINAVLNRKKLARTSQKPGKTRLVNYFLVNKRFYFVDVPGYGFARADKKTIMSFKKMIESYLENSGHIRGAVLLLDVRRIPNDDDRLMMNYFHARRIPVMFVLTKSDKPSRNTLADQQRKIRESLDFQPGDAFFTFSAVTRLNKDAILDVIAQWVGGMDD